jgi:hypothetical protein
MGFITDLLGGSDQADATTQAANIQAQSSAAQVAQQSKQFDAIQKLLAPYVNAGTGALSGQQNLIGLNGNQAQQTAIDGIQNGSQFQSMLKQGENSILQNASATGGLRGGNTQAALSQYSPTLLNQYIQQQYGNLGGLSSNGQKAAAGVGDAGQNSTNAINTINQASTNALTGSVIANGNTQANTVNQVVKLGGGLYSSGALGEFALGSAGTGSGLLGALGSIFSFSDKRLKKDLKRIGTHKLGIGIYEYIKLGQREIGVLAQELEKVMPQAVKLHESGYKMVDYSMLEAAV